MTIHLPVLRHGKAHRSLEVDTLRDVHGDPIGEVSQAPPALVRRDARGVGAARDALRQIPFAERVAATVRAADLLMTARLPTGDGHDLSLEEHLDLCARTTGLPRVLVRAGLDKVAHVARHLPEILHGLAPGIDLGPLLDERLGTVHGVPYALRPTTDALAALLPSNAPGVHTLWLPAPALETPVALRPGARDPWTPWRILQALIAAGLPPEAFSYYPSGHEVADALTTLHGRSVVFGGPDVARRYAARPEVAVHGPGNAKILVGPDALDTPGLLDVLTTSVLHNGGRSCINASTIVAPPGSGDRLADALATRLARATPRPLDAPDACLAAEPDPARAKALADRLAHALRDPDARDASAPHHPELVLRCDGLSFLRPTVLRCPPHHPLARTELPFPFVAVVELDPIHAIDWIGPTLVATLISEDPATRRALLDARHVDRVHLGPVPTSTLRWDQPHEGNLVTWLWARRPVAWAEGWG